MATASPEPRLSGRRAQAARNDEVIKEAARTVFLNDPSAPIAAVAQAASVGISALYRRYSGKEELVRTLCRDGLRRYLEVAGEALAVDDPWEALMSFLRGIVDSDVHSLTVRLAGTFTPTAELNEMATRATQLTGRILRRAKSAGVVRKDLQLNDLPMLFEQMTAIRGSDASRTAELRRRYLALHLDALRPRAAEARLPGRPPTDAELAARWIPRSM
jgi:AcrR family transcriptional regulator